MRGDVIAHSAEKCGSTLKYYRNRNKRSDTISVPRDLLVANVVYIIIGALMGPAHVPERLLRLLHYVLNNTIRRWDRFD